MTPFFTLLLFGLSWQPPTLPDVRLSDLAVFPSRDVAVFCCAAAAHHRCEIARRPPFGSQQECDEWHRWHVIADRDAFLRWDVWDDLAIAHDMTSGDYRLWALRRLRDRLGPNYWRGCLPSPVPGD